MKEKIIIAGPCSLESPEQLDYTARALDLSRIDYMRGGIWKPRTRPGNYEGVGAAGLEWFAQMKREHDVKIITEVATAEQVDLVLKAGVDAVWVGARSTVNPFYVQQIADALRGVDIPVFIKNPINPDLSLWIGAIERVRSSIAGETYAIHRGFSSFRKFKYRNQPQWTIPISLMQHMPELKIICDPSHIAGDQEVVHEVAQQAYDLQFDGLMVEIHPHPPQAKSDADQQLTPEHFMVMLDELVIRQTELTSSLLNSKMTDLREQIDELDLDLVHLLAQRMRLSSTIGDIKAEESISILQPERWKWIINRARREGNKEQLSEEFIVALFNVIHEESINRQIDVMKNQKG